MPLYALYGSNKKTISFHYFYFTMIEIQKASPNDAALISTIAKITFIESHGHSASEKNICSYIDAHYSVEAINKELADEKNNYHLIYFNQKLAGFSNIIYNSSNPKIDEKALTKLDRIYILKEFYGLQLGAALFEFNLRLSVEAGQKGMWLYVWTENQRAVGFYKKAGFEIIANTSFKISEDHSNPNYWMYKKYLRV